MAESIEQLHVISPLQTLTLPTTNSLTNLCQIITSSTMALVSIRTNDDKIEIVDQLLLPHITKFVEVNSIEDAHDAIKSMKVSNRLNSS